MAGPVPVNKMLRVLLLALVPPLLLFCVLFVMLRSHEPLRPMVSWQNFASNIANKLSEQLWSESIEGTELHQSIEAVRASQVARRLRHEIRLLCWVAVDAQALTLTTKVIRETWGNRCDKLVFFSTVEDPANDVVNVGEGWAGTRFAVTHLHKYHLDHYDWFLRADNDTFVMVDTLRYMVSSLDPRSLPYLVTPDTQNNITYNGTGLGNVMSAEVLKKLVEEGLADPTLCPVDPTPTPALPRDPIRESTSTMLGNCLMKLGVNVAEQGRVRFWQAYKTTRFSAITEWGSTSLNTCLSFHGMSASELYMLEYLVYGVQVFGYFPKPLPM